MIYKIGIVGAGMIAEKHIENLLLTQSAKIEWVADIKEVALERIKQKFPAIAKTTNNYKDILNDVSVDAIVVCTPPPMHKQVFIDAVNAGKHILVEKPLAMNLADIDEMIAAKNNHPELKICDCSGRHSRLQPKYKRVKEIIDSGVLGNIYYIHHNCIWRQNRAGIEYHPTAKWFLNKAIAGGGPLFDWGVYDLAFHLGILNDQHEIIKVNNTILKNGLDAVDPKTDIFDVEEHFISTMEFSNGLNYYWERSNNANMEADNETRIYGTRGGIKLAYNTWDSAELTFFDVDNDAKGKARSKTEIIDMSKHKGDDFELSMHFINMLNGTEETVLPLELARKHLDIIFKCYNKSNN